MRCSLLPLSAALLLLLVARPVRSQVDLTPRSPRDCPESVAGDTCSESRDPYLGQRCPVPPECKFAAVPQDNLPAAALLEAEPPPAPLQGEPNLEPPPAPLPTEATPARVRIAVARTRPAVPSRTVSLRPWKWATLVPGVLLGGAGAALVALDRRAGGDCWMPGDLSTCRVLLQSQAAGAALLGAGGAAVVGAAVLFIIDARRERARPLWAAVHPMPAL